MLDNGEMHERNASMCGENCIYLKQKKAKHARQDT